MNRLKTALEKLDVTISDLEDKVGIDAVTRAEAQRKHNEWMRQSRARETSVMAVAQKVALRLDQTIEHVEKVLKS